MFRRKISKIVVMLLIAFELAGSSPVSPGEKDCPLIYWPILHPYYAGRFMSHHPLAWNDAKMVKERFVAFGDTLPGYTMKYPEIVPRRKVKDMRPECLVVWGRACDTTLEWKAVLAHDSLEFRDKIERYRWLASEGYEDSATAILRPIDVPIRSVFRLRPFRVYSDKWKEMLREHRKRYPPRDSTRRSDRLKKRPRELPPKYGNFYLTIETDRFLEEGGYVVIFAMDREEIGSGKAEAYADKFIAGIVKIEEKEWVKPDSTWTRSYPRYKMAVILGKLRQGSNRVQYCPSILPERPGSKSAQ